MGGAASGTTAGSAGTGTYPGGVGATGISTNGVGSNATATGGGGSGARGSSGSATTRVGGNGAAGKVILTYTLPACSGTPSPGNTIASVNPVASGGTTVLSLQNTTTGSGVTYQWQSSSDNSTWNNISLATSATYSASPTAATYYRCNVTCSGNTGASNSVLVTLTYCAPAATLATSFITNFTTTNGFTNINKTSTFSSGGYVNYTATDTVKSFATGSVGFTVALTGATGGIAIWVDWNNNFGFDGGELM